MAAPDAVPAPMARIAVTTNTTATTTLSKRLIDMLASLAEKFLKKFRWFPDFQHH
jgi:hypothetical protein